MKQVVFLTDSFVFFFFFFLCNFGLAGSLMLHTWVFSGCGEWGLCFSCSREASHCSDFSCCGAQALGPSASVVAAGGL